MKIAYILPSLDFKAPIFLVKKISDYFISEGNEVTVFYFDDIVNINFNCKTIRITMRTKIDFDYFDIIHSNLLRPDKYISKNHKHIKRAKTISTIHCNIKDDLYYSYGKLVSLIYTKKWIYWLSKIDYTVQINDYLMDCYSKKLKNNKLIYNGISVSNEKDNYDEIIKHIEKYKKEKLTVLCSYSNIVKRKGLFQILKLLIKRNDLAYICIGDGNYKKKLEKFVKKNKLNDRVYFSSNKKNPYNVLEYSDLFMIPSYSEGFSLALLEAGLIGASVVCSNIPSFNLPFSNNEVTFFETDKIDSLSNAVNLALINKKTKMKCLQQKIKEEISENCMYEKYKALYSEMIL